MTGAQDHGMTRAVDRFTLADLASEFRALRASVTEMWLRRPDVAVDEARQLIRFSESIDQLLAESISHFIAKQELTSELFTAAIGHDLRNPLNVVALAVQSLTLSEGLSSGDRKILEQVGGAVSRQARLLDDLADFSRTRMGGLAELHRSECDVFDLCNAMARELAPSHPNIETARLGNTMAFVDPLRIEQLVSNLVANAVQHGSASGKVAATVVGTTDSIAISVHNDGPPIPQDRLERCSARSSGSKRIRTVGMATLASGYSLRAKSQSRTAARLPLNRTPRTERFLQRLFPANRRRAIEATGVSVRGTWRIQGRNPMPEPSTHE